MNLGFRSCVSTFHSLLFKYRLPLEFDGEDVKFEIERQKPRVEGVELLICDEASMLADLDVEAMERDYRVIYVGDAAQLPPVIAERMFNGRAAIASTVLSNPDVTLTTIHRQAGGSSILEAASLVREGVYIPAAIWDDTATQVLNEDEGHVDRSMFRQLVEAADVVLVARNVARVRINELVRELRGYSQYPCDWLPKAGKILVSSDRTSDFDFPRRPGRSAGEVRGES